MSVVHIEPLGDCALLIRFGERIDPELNARALAAAQALRNAKLAGVTDVAPAYASVCVRYDPRAWLDPTGTSAPHERIGAHIEAIVSTWQPATDQPQLISPNDADCVEIPVCYGGEFGPDLGDVAKHAGLDEDEVVARHSSAEYRVAMLGFAPGFAYLLGLDARLHTPRRATPRTRVPAGAVAIGGAQTGVYPRELPGGWHIVGRTPRVLFDAAREPPALLAPGQRVRFHAIDAREFTTSAR